MHGGNQKCIQNFGCKTGRNETMWETKDNIKAESGDQFSSLKDKGFLECLSKYKHPRKTLHHEDKRLVRVRNDAEGYWS
jgi:hypothetical protein